MIRKMMKYRDDISREMEGWVAESARHLIRFSGERFLGPYEEEGQARVLNIDGQQLPDVHDDDPGRIGVGGL